MRDHEYKVWAQIERREGKEYPDAGEPGEEHYNVGEPVLLFVTGNLTAAERFLRATGIWGYGGAFPGWTLGQVAQYELELGKERGSDMSNESSIFRIEERRTDEIITVYKVEAYSYEDAIDAIQGGEAEIEDVDANSSGDLEYHLLEEWLPTREEKAKA